MFNVPFCCPYSVGYPRIAKSPYIRILHASPDAPAVDVYANGNLIANNLAFKKFTEYFPVPAGRYTIKIYPAGQKNQPVLETNVSIPEKSIVTVAAVGNLSKLELLAVPDNIMSIPPRKAYVRFVHLSPDAPGVDITTPDGTKLFADVEFKEISNYRAVNPGMYTLQARVAGTSQVVLNVPNVRIRQGRFYTVYAVGLAGGNPPLQVLIALDGNTYIGQAR